MNFGDLSNMHSERHMLRDEILSVVLVILTQEV